MTTVQSYVLIASNRPTKPVTLKRTAGWFTILKYCI